MFQQPDLHGELSGSPLFLPSTNLSPPQSGHGFSLPFEPILMTLKASVRRALWPHQTCSAGPGRASATLSLKPPPSELVWSGGARVLVIRGKGSCMDKQGPLWWCADCGISEELARRLKH